MRNDFEKQQKQRLEALGQTLRELRTSRGLSLDDIPFRSRGILSRPALARLEKGQSGSIDIFNLAILSRIYAVPLEHLLVPLDLEEYLREVVTNEERLI